MALLRDMSDKFWNYVSPRKTQQRRDKSFRPKLPPVPQHFKKESVSSTISMSPEMRIRNWDVSTPRPSGLGSADEAQLPPSPPTSLERPYTDFEGDTLIDSMAEKLNIHPEDDWDANEATMVLDDGQYVEEHKEKDAEMERERRETQGRELRAAGWTEDAVFLFQKLGMRGFEPLLSYNWFEDFTMLPADLFTRNMDKAFIQPMSSSIEYHAYRALEDLFGVGGRVRDAVLQKAPERTAEYQTQAAVLKYNKWALKDGKIQNTWKGISLFDTVTCSKTEDASVAEKRMLRKLDKSAKLWRDAFQERRTQDETLKSKSSRAVDYDSGPELPTLYGVISCYTIMAFVSYDVHAAEPLLRTVAMFDLGQEGYDVWNSLAIAIFVIHCRNRMMQLQDCLPLPEDTETVSDPDA